MNLSAMPLQFIARASDSAAIFMGAIFVVLTLMVIVSASRGGGAARAKGVRKGSLKKWAKHYNLDKQHVQLLQQAVKQQQIINIHQFFHNMGYLSRATQKIIESTEHSNLEQKHKVQIIAQAFELRRRVEDKFLRLQKSQKKGIPICSSRARNLLCTQQTAPRGVRE